MTMTKEQRDEYAAAELAKINPEYIYDHYQQYSSKFGIYFMAELSGYAGYVLTARFTSIGPNKDWLTDDDQFKLLVDAVLNGKSGGGGKK